MKLKKIIIGLFLLCLISIHKSSGQLSLDATAGYNISDFVNNIPEVSSDLGSVNGIFLGLRLKNDFVEKTAWGIDLQYSQKGGTIM